MYLRVAGHALPDPQVWYESFAIRPNEAATLMRINEFSASTGSDKSDLGNAPVALTHHNLP